MEQGLAQNQNGEPVKKKSSNKSNGSNNQNKDNGSKKKKNFSERAGDWVCGKCKNLNFSFRNSCNRCHILRCDSEKPQNVPIIPQTTKPVQMNIHKSNENLTKQQNTNKFDAFMPGNQDHYQKQGNNFQYYNNKNNYNGYGNKLALFN